MKRVGQLYRSSLVNRIKDKVNNNDNVFLLSYTKLSSAQLNDIRKGLKEAGADMYVSRNTLASLALKELKHDKLAERLNGQTAFVWTNADSVEISKVLVKFTKDFQGLKVQGGLIDGKLIEKEDVKKLSDLPPREVLLAQLLGTIQAPVTRLLYVLNAKSQDLLSILKQLSEKKGGN